MNWRFNGVFKLSASQIFLSGSNKFHIILAAKMLHIHMFVFISLAFAVVFPINIFLKKRFSTPREPSSLWTQIPHFWTLSSVELIQYSLPLLFCPVLWTVYGSGNHFYNHHFSKPLSTSQIPMECSKRSILIKLSSQRVYRFCQYVCNNYSRAHRLLFCVASLALQMSVIGLYRTNLNTAVWYTWDVRFTLKLLIRLVY